MITLQNLTKHYGRKKKRQTAIEDLTFTVEKGESFGFLGKNGAGKSTTIQILTTLIQPSSGTATVARFDVRKKPMEVRRRIGYVPEAVGFYPHMKGSDLIVYLAELQGMGKDEAQDRAASLFTRLSLDDWVDKKIKTYSFGTKRKLGLIQALVHDPEVLILDEPTNGLDPQTRYEFRQMIRELHQEGKTIFLSTHELEDVQQLCQRVGILRDGKLAALDTEKNLTKLISEKLHRKMLVEGRGFTEQMAEDIGKIDGVVNVNLTPYYIDLQLTPGGEVAGKVNGVLVTSGAEVTSLRTDDPDLEDVFLAVTGGEE